MAEMEVKVRVTDMPKVKAMLDRIKKIQRRRAWKNKRRTQKARNNKWR